MEKPKEPQPADFGLTSERIAEFEASAAISLMHRRGGEIIFSSALLSGVIVYAWTRNIAVTIAAILVGWIPVCRVLMRIVDAFARRAREKWPDHDAYVRYRIAQARYSQALAEWIHFQELQWQALDGRTFETELAKFLAAEGFQVRHTGGARDSGVDLVLADPQRSGLTILVQCKAHRNPVGPSAVRDLYGTLSHYGGQEAWLISTHGFTRAAFEFADGKPIRLVHINTLLTVSATQDRQDSAAS